MPDAPEVVVKFERVNPATLVQHPRNPNSADVGAIAGSLARFGMYAPVIVQRSTKHILCGNHTTQAAIANGMKQVAVGWVDVDDETALAILVGDNQLARLALNDDAALAEVLTELAQSHGLEGTGFDGDDLDALLHDLSYRDERGEGGQPGELDATEIRSLVLAMSADDHDRVVTGLQRLRNAWGTDSNVAVVLRLLDGALASIG